LHHRKGRVGLPKPSAPLIEGFGFEGTVALLDEDLDLAFGFVEFFFARCGEANPFFEELNGVFEREIALLERFDDGFEFLERFFEGWHVQIPSLLYGGRLHSRFRAACGSTLAITSAAAV
jgi:hypothetical protein